MIKHTWEYCDHCEHDVVICGKCGNNTCNGGYGTVNGKECDACESAYQLYLKGENDEFKRVDMSINFGSIDTSSMHIPKQSKWTAYLIGSPAEPGGAVVYEPNEGKEPNWFHRQMHRLLLGIKWYKNVS